MILQHESKMLTDVWWHAWLLRTPLLVFSYLSLPQPHPLAEHFLRVLTCQNFFARELYQLSSLSPVVRSCFLCKAARPQAQELAEHRLKPKLCTIRPLLTTWYVKGAISGWLGKLTSTSPTKPPGCCTCKHNQCSCHPQGSTAIRHARRSQGAALTLSHHMLAHLHALCGACMPACTQRSPSATSRTARSLALSSTAANHGLQACS